MSDAVEMLADEIGWILTDPFADVPVKNGYEDLTKRQRDILWLAAQGYTKKEIGDKLDLSPQTAGNHVSQACKKLGVSKSDLPRIVFDLIREVIK